MKNIIHQFGLESRGALNKLYEVPLTQRLVLKCIPSTYQTKNVTTTSVVSRKKIDSRYICAFLKII